MVHKLERNYLVLRQKPSHVISGLSTVMQPSHSKTMPGKWCPTGEAGRERSTDLSVRQTLLLFHKKVIMSSRQPKWNMLLTGTRSGPHASLWTGSVWCYWEDSYPAAFWYLLHISPWPKAPVAKSEFHPPSVWDKKNHKSLISRQKPVSTCYLLCIFTKIYNITFESSVRRWSESSSVSSEGEHPFSVILVEKLMGDGAPAKPEIRDLRPLDYSVGLNTCQYKYIHNIMFLDR